MVMIVDQHGEPWGGSINLDALLREADGLIAAREMESMNEPLDQAEWQQLIDSGALSLRQLAHRCRCGRVISENKNYCYSCITAEIAKAREAMAREGEA